MRAGLERHVERRAARRLARLGEREPFGVRAPAGRGHAAADDDAVLDQDRADRRVRRGEPERPLAEVQRGLHPAFVVVLRHGRRAHGADGSLRLRAAAVGDRLRLRFKFADDRIEIARFAEIAIDRGEAHIGDVVERLQALHDQFADPVGRDVAVGLALELAHDAVDHALDPLGLDGALAQRDLDRAHQLVAVERRAPAVLLDHHQFAQLDALEGGEPPAAIGADPPAADRGGILGRPRVLHLRVETAAIGAPHREPTPLFEPSSPLSRSGSAGSIRRRRSRTFASTAALPDLAVRRQAVERLDDQFADLGELGDAEAARGRGGRAEPDARGHHRLLRVERDAVLVAGDVGAPERGLGRLAGEPLRRQIDQHQVVVGAAGHQLVAAGQDFGAASALALATTAWA